MTEIAKIREQLYLGLLAVTELERKIMATQYGWQKADALAEKGWTVVHPPRGVFGDPRVIDPVTNREHSPYEGEEIQRRREEGQNSEPK